jgi:hypothetical protein
MTHDELAQVYGQQAVRLEAMAQEIRAFNTGLPGPVDMLPGSLQQQYSTLLWKITGLAEKWRERAEMERRAGSRARAS